MTRAAVSLAIFAAALLAQDKSPDDLLKVPVPPGARRIAYGRDPLQFGELRLPPGNGPFPVAVIVHGGCWMAKLGNLDDRVVALDLVRPIAAALTQMGIATWNLEYRRLGNAGGGWPGTFQDVARGTDHLRRIAAENHLDLARVIAIGHSAGGSLVLWLGGRAKIPPESEIFTKDPLPLKGIVDLDGPGDLRALLPRQQSICGAPVITQLLGGAPEDVPQHYRAADPIEMLPLGPSVDYFAGQMFAKDASDYEPAARRAGDAVHTVVLPKAGHFVFLDPENPAWPQVAHSVRSILGLK